MNTYIDYTIVLRDVGINIVSLYYFSYKILYQRYHNKELFVICSLFNIFLLLVIMALVRSTFSVGVGFGLFGLLGIVTLRSAPFTKAEMAFMFGGITLAVINGAGLTDLFFVLTCNVTIILSAIVISTWSIENSANIMPVEVEEVVEVAKTRRLAVILDRVDPDALNNHGVMKDKLRMMFNIDMIDFKVQKVDYVRDVMEITIYYPVGPADIPGSADQERYFAHTGDELALPIPNSTSAPQ